MKNLREVSFALVLLSAGFAPGAWAELCAMDAVPAATRLLPYFEVDVVNPSGKTTVFSANDAVARTTLAPRLAVWRDTKVRQRVTGACPARWFSLGERRVDSFDEEENADSHCQSGIADPALPCFGLATQPYEIGNAPNGGFLFPESPFGWLFLNLSHDLASDDPFPGRAQAWVTTVLSASGRYSVATDAVVLDDLCSPDAGQGSAHSP